MHGGRCTRSVRPGGAREVVSMHCTHRGACMHSVSHCGAHCSQKDAADSSIASVSSHRTPRPSERARVPTMSAAMSGTCSQMLSGRSASSPVLPRACRISLLGNVSSGCADSAPTPPAISPPSARPPSAVVAVGAVPCEICKKASTESVKDSSSEATRWPAGARASSAVVSPRTAGALTVAGGDSTPAESASAESTRRAERDWCRVGCEAWASSWRSGSFGLAR